VIDVSLKMMGRKMRFGSRQMSVALAGAIALFVACGGEGENDGEAEPVDDWKCGTHSSVSEACRCDTPIEKAGRTPTLDCNGSEYVCCTYSEGPDWKSCSCYTADALAEKGFMDCEAFAEEFSASDVDSCPP
jgi:hypothetical protein